MGKTPVKTKGREQGVTQCGLHVAPFVIMAQKDCQ